MSSTCVGWLRASAGKFNDIFVRDYSVSAESPVKLLVLSRFDIFHLMSPEARESLQRSEAGFVRESIESRALKTVAWERYRKKFVEDIIASKRATSGIQSGRASSRMTKSTSTPALSTEKTALKKLVEPGSLTMKMHRIGMHGSPNGKAATLIQPVPSSNPSRHALNKDARERQASLNTVSEDRQRRYSDSLLSPVGDEDNRSSQVDNDGPTKGTLELSRRRLTAPDMAAAMKPALLSLPDKDAPSKSPINDTSYRSDDDSVCATQAALPSGQQATSERTKLTRSGNPNSKLARSRTLVVLMPLEGSQSPIPSNKRLHDPSIVSGRANHRVSTKTLKPERSADALSPVQAKVSCASAIWSPVHGVCQPFSLLGFLKETLALTRASASSSSRARKLQQLGSASATDTDGPSATANEREASKSETVVAAFRVFGKFRDLNEALHTFRLVCGTEQVRPAADTTDTGSFAIYKEDEITMVLENFFSETATPAPIPATATSPLQGEPTQLLASSSSSASHQFRAGDLLHGTGQRFACVSVTLALPATAIESVVVHVYQCFPTLQSATRFAKHMATSAGTAAPLLIVPLFEWIPVADIECFDAKHADLEQALEAVAAAGADGYRSTWKARKDAAKKARARHPPPRSKA